MFLSGYIVYLKLRPLTDIVTVFFFLFFCVSVFAPVTLSFLIVSSFDDMDIPSPVSLLRHGGLLSTSISSRQDTLHLSVSFMSVTVLVKGYVSLIPSLLDRRKKEREVEGPKGGPCTLTFTSDVHSRRDSTRRFVTFLLFTESTVCLGPGLVYHHDG